MTIEERTAALEAVADETRVCRACRLCESATNAVPGEGPTDARVLFIGEAPGYHEDRQGRPFIGPAGQLLEELLGGIGLGRKDVFIANVVKHRPPGNRDPLPDEILACKPFMDRQIAAIQPDVIVAIGRFAMGQFLQGASISVVHGQARKLGGRHFMPIIHPAAALRRGDWRIMLEEDIQALGKLLGELGRDGGAERVEVAEPTPPPEQMSLF